MSIKKYKKPLRNFIIYAVLIVVMFLLISPTIANQNISLLLPGEGVIEVTIMMLVFYPLSAIIGGVLFGYVLGPLFLVIHKKTIGLNMSYGIQENLESEKFRGGFKAFFPALMAINFSLMFALNENTANAIIYDLGMGSGSPGVPTSIISIVASLILLTFTIAVAMGLFSPVWFLLDAGIVYSNKERVERKNLEQPIVGRSVGGWYMYLLKGYAGIAVIFSYFQLIFTFFSRMIELGASDDMTLVFVINIVLLAPLMFLIALSALPAVILLDLTKKNRINYMRKVASMLGIKEQVKISFEYISEKQM